MPGYRKVSEVLILHLTEFFFYLFQEKAKGPENEMAKMEKLLSLVREPSAKN